MKSKIISVLILSSTLILSTILILTSFALSKGKPDLNSEWITFVGDLAGSQEVEGCCGNAGPFPNYTMTLSEEVFPPEMTRKPHDGNIFMNIFMNRSSKGAGKQKSYIVQFWWTEDDYYFIEIKGGVIEHDKKAKILTVTFIGEPCKIWVNDLLLPTPVPVTFTLTRAQP
jgi:hypothetical protein